MHCSALKTPLLMSGQQEPTCKQSWITMCRVPTPAFFGQHEWFCVLPWAVGSLEAGAVVGEGFGAGNKTVLCSWRCAPSHLLRGKAEVTPGSYSSSLPGRTTITCEPCLRWLLHRQQFPWCGLGSPMEVPAASKSSSATAFHVFQSKPNNSLKPGPQSQIVC